MTETHTQDHQADMMDEAIAQAFVAARRRLQPEHHSRLIKAWELVVERAVIDNADGSHTVKGVDQPEYLVDPSGCTCTDCTSGKAPKQLCKHILAVALEKRSRQKFQDMAEALAARPAPVEALPEAPISICMKGTLSGIPNTMVTLRGHSMAQIEALASQVRAQGYCISEIFDRLPQAPTPPIEGPVGRRNQADPAELASGSPGWAIGPKVGPTPDATSTPMCPDHGTPMKPSKFGGWYCPQTTGDVFCKQKIAAKRAPFVPPAAYQSGFRG